VPPTACLPPRLTPPLLFPLPAAVFNQFYTECQVGFVAAAACLPLSPKAAGAVAIKTGCLCCCTAAACCGCWRCCCKLAFQHPYSVHPLCGWWAARRRARACCCAVTATLIGLLLLFSCSSFQVVGSPEEGSRLLLCEATALTMRACFQLLGIHVLYRI